jgi:hypothetical protein
VSAPLRPHLPGSAEAAANDIDEASMLLMRNADRDAQIINPSM